MSKFKVEGKVSPFSLEGRFIAFVDHHQVKPKRIRVATGEGEYQIKLSKELRYIWREALQPGDWIQVFGKQKYKPKTGEQKLKAYQLKVTTPAHKELQSPNFKFQASNHQPLANTTPEAKPKGKVCVLVCQKSSCCKRGAAQVYQALQESVTHNGLEEEVTIKKTGCMKQCKQGPCIVFMPDKSRYTKVAPKDIHQLVDRHFADKLKPEGSKPELLSVP